VFTRDAAGVWSQQAYIKASNTETADGFGSSGDLSGDTLVVAAQSEDSAATGINGDQNDNSASNAGAVYVFTRDAVGVWSQQAYVKASNTDSGDFFSGPAALSGDTLVVAAHLEASAATGINGDQNDNSAGNAGAVYVFTRDAAAVWSQQAYIKASNTEAGDQLGRSVALSSDTLVVGTPTRTAPPLASMAIRATTTRLVPVPSMSLPAIRPVSGRSKPISRRPTPKPAMGSAGRSRSQAIGSWWLPFARTAPRLASMVIRATTVSLTPVLSMCSRAMRPGSGRSRLTSKRPTPMPAMSSVPRLRS
jgi:hypothetical protein